MCSPRNVEMTTSGVSLWCADFRMNRMSSSPLMSVMLMSVTIRSYGPRGRRRIASKPLLASTTSHPPRGPANSAASSTARTKARVEAESSTIKTLRMDPQSKAYYEPERTKATNPLAH